MPLHLAQARNYPVLSAAPRRGAHLPGPGGHLQSATSGTCAGLPRSPDDVLLMCRVFSWRFSFPTTFREWWCSCIVLETYTSQDVRYMLWEWHDASFCFMPLYASDRMSIAFDVTAKSSPSSTPSISFGFDLLATASLGHCFSLVLCLSQAVHPRFELREKQRDLRAVLMPPLIFGPCVGLRPP